MSEFRLTQISDTHLARRYASLTDNFHRLSEYIDTKRPDLVVNSGDLAFDAAPTSPDDLEFARSLHAGLPVPCRYLPGNHDIGDNPTAVGPTPPKPATEQGRQAFIDAFGEDRWRFEAAGLVLHRPQFAGHEHGACRRSRTVRVADGAQTCLTREWVKSRRWWTWPLATSRRSADPSISTRRLRAGIGT